jgi:hypothetical protein
VSPSGNDSNDGLTPSTPFATLTGARDALRAATGRTADGTSTITGVWTGAQIRLMDGTYDLSGAALVLDERDRGTEEHPVVWRAADGASVVITAGHAVPSASWLKIIQSGAGAGEINDPTTWGRLPVAARGKVYRLDVNALGIDKGTIAWSLANEGDNSPVDENELRPLEAGLPGVMSRWPNADTTAGEDQIASAWAPIKSYSNGTTDTITLEDDTPGAWATAGQYPLIYGAWADAYNLPWWGFSGLSQSGGDTVITGGIDIEIKRNNPLAGFLAIRNMLQALDDPGDYVWHVDTGYLYYWPRSDAAPGDAVRVSLARTIVDLNEAHDITFSGLVFEGGRNRMVRALASHRVVFDGCTFRNFAGKLGGLYAEEATGLRVTDCTFSHGTQTALRVHAGDRDTLTLGDVEITDSTFDHIGYEAKQGILPGLYFVRDDEPIRPPDRGAACGILVARNTMTNFRDTVCGGAAYLTFEDNTVEDFCTIVGDAGAIGFAFSYATPGYIVRRNVFRGGNRLGYDVGGGNTYQHQSYGALFTIYLDLAGGAVVEDNLFEDVDHAMIIAGGKNHAIRRNRFVDAGKGHFNAANVVFGSRTGSPHLGGVPEAELMEDLVKRPLSSAPWPTLYPEVIQYRVGGVKHAVGMYHENIVFVDNMTDKASGRMVQFEANTAPATVSGFSVGVDWTQLQYPLGSDPANTVPVSGGGTVPLTSLDG